MRIIALDSQKLNEIQLCGLKYKYSHKENLRTPYKATALENGDLLHIMISVYYNDLKSGKRWQDAVNNSINTSRAAIPLFQIDEEESENVIKTFIEYSEYYQHKEEGYEILAVEAPFSKELYKDENLQIIYEGKIDLLVKEKDLGILPIDHKSSKQRRQPSKLSNQFFGYTWAVGANNLIVNKIGFQKTLKPEEKFQRYTLNYPTKLFDWWIDSVKWWVTQLIIYEETNRWPANLTSCDKYGGCIFQGICDHVESMRPYLMKRDFLQGEPWDVGKELEVIKS